MDRLEFLKRMGLLAAGAVAINLDAKASAIQALSEGEIPAIAAEDRIASKIEPLDAKLASRLPCWLSARVVAVEYMPDTPRDFQAR